MPFRAENSIIGKPLLWLLTAFLLHAGDPVRCDTRESTASQHSEYSEIDNVALSVPDSLTGSCSLLAAYFNRMADTDTAKVRAAYVWIVSNIQYSRAGVDDDAYAWAKDPDEVLKNRKTICEGYSSLFECLAKDMGIEVERIRGYLKGSSYEVCDQLDDRSSHAWNAVNLGGKWHLLDCSAPAQLARGSVQKPYSWLEFFFLTPPSQMIYDHFPYTPFWQLLERKLSLGEFEALPYVTPDFFDLGLEWQDGISCRIEVDDDLLMHLVAPHDVVLLSDLTVGGTELSDEWTFQQREGDKYWIHARFPHPGEYILRVYAKSKSDTGGMYHQVGRLAVQANVSRKPAVGYPETWRDFGDWDAFLYEPMMRELKAGDTVHFKIRVPMLERVSLDTGGMRWIELERRGDVFEGTAVVRRGEVHILGQYPPDGVWMTLVRYDCE